MADGSVPCSNEIEPPTGYPDRLHVRDSPIKNYGALPIGMFLDLPYPAIHERLFTMPAMYRLTPPFPDGGCSRTITDIANGPSFPSSLLLNAVIAKCQAVFVDFGECCLERSARESPSRSVMPSRSNRSRKGIRMRRLHSSACRSWLTVAGPWFSMY